MTQFAGSGPSVCFSGYDAGFLNLSVRSQRRGMENRVQKLFKAIAPAKRGWYSDPAACNGEHRQNHQRNHHHSRALVNAAMSVAVAVFMRVVSMSIFGGATVFAEESQKPQPEHVERSEKGGENSERPEYPAGLVSAPQNFVLAEEAGERRYAGDGECAGSHGPECPRNLGAQAAHLPHVLFARDGVDHRASGQEQQSFEEGVRHQVKDAGGERSHTAGHEHVSKLRNRRVGEDFLDISLRDPDGGGEQGGQRSDDCDHGQCHAARVRK